jgi:transcriptional regulator with XRE-family HTH domain
MRSFGQRFREILRRQRLTQTDAARLLETTQSAISYYCTLERLPRRRILGIMSTRLGVELAELTGEREIARPRARRPLKMPAVAIAEPDERVYLALTDLKKRWKKSPREHSTMKHLIAALFAGKADQIVAWLEAD